MKDLNFKFTMVLFGILALFAITVSIYNKRLQQFPVLVIKIPIVKQLNL